MARLRGKLVSALTLGLTVMVAGAAAGFHAVDKTEIITCSAKGQPPSDPFPVAARMQLPAGK
jgi:hypothetical protein